MTRPISVILRLVVPVVLSIPGIPAFGVAPSLIDAAKSGDYETVQSLLDRKSTDVNAAMPDGATALHWAALHDDADLAAQLLQAGASAGAANEYGVTPLYLACTNRSDSMVRILLQAGADPNAVLLSGETVLMNCSRTGAVEAVRMLIKAGADVNRAESGSGQTALMWAAAGGHADIVSILVTNGADIRARTQPGVPTIPRACSVCDWKVSSGDFTPLLFAARAGDVETAKILLDAGADPDEATVRRGNSLVVASAGGHEELALYLIERGADIRSADDDGVTALHHAVGGGLSLLNGVIYDDVYRLRPRNQYRLAEAILSKGMDPNVQIKRAQLLGPDGYPFTMIGATPLLLAVASADIRMMHMLLDAGADPGIRTGEGVTLLIAAAQVACTGTCAYQAGGNIADKDRIALALATVKEVMKLDVDINAVDKSGRSAMHIAGFTGSDAVVQYLADHGAAVDSENQEGETPWTMASGLSPDYGSRGLYGHHAGTAALLLKLGAKPRSFNLVEGSPATE